ncbi:nitrous oxide reductase family maturation protein NosD [Shewanella sp. YIC-542]|uniref:nitrous oxide reductase family maturation protein NosD n=1 Tax=Shewanella mytili TaxID=3377111 RepID=UPI00398E3134
MKRLTLGLLLWCLAPLLWAANWQAQPGQALQPLLDNAASGDTIVLPAGDYPGPLTVSKPLQLQGQAGATLVGNGSGSALFISAADTRVAGLTIRNWGDDVFSLDAGVQLLPGAHRAQLRHLTLQGPGYGIYAEQLQAPVIEDCTISGDPQLYVLDRGDGIAMRYVTDPQVHRNHMQNVRDGIYLEDVNGSRLSHNEFQQLQYGIHYMYTHDDVAWHNHAQSVTGGYALMSSKDITLTDNQVRDAVDFGILLNVTTNSVVQRNLATQVHNPRARPQDGTEGKALFIYDARDNHIRANRFAVSDIGISVAMGAEGNHFYGNSMIHNHTQVRYIGTRALEWSHQGRGNYWSSYQGWDLNGDGVGDHPYQPNDALDRLLWLYPSAQQLLDSPVVQLLRWLSATLALQKDVGITDSHPLLGAVPIGDDTQNAPADAQRNNAVQAHIATQLQEVTDADH